LKKELQEFDYEFTVLKKTEGTLKKELKKV